MREYLTRKIRRLGFYARGVIRDRQSGRRFRRRLQQAFGFIDIGSLDPSVVARVNYYNKLDRPFALNPEARLSSSLSRSEGSYYYYDLKEHLLYFPQDLKLNWIFGDNILIPQHPSIVKSRPIGSDNHNAVVLKLDKLRHYTLFSFRDKMTFREKASRAVWRGMLNNPLRLALVNRFGNSTRHDIAYVDEPGLECSLPPGAPLCVTGQLGSRYVLSVEGYDVATNLKWIFNSRSLCLMPRPRYETWFMEGMLRDGVHYVQLRDDFADLDDKIDWFDAHPGEAETIIDNANRHFRQFMDEEREDLIALLVLQKYFERSGQLTPLPFSSQLFSASNSGDGSTAAI